MKRYTSLLVAGSACYTFAAVNVVLAAIFHSTLSALHVAAAIVAVGAGRYAFVTRRHLRTRWH